MAISSCTTLWLQMPLAFPGGSRDRTQVLVFSRLYQPSLQHWEHLNCFPFATIQILEFRELGTVLSTIKPWVFRETVRIWLYAEYCFSKSGDCHQMPGIHLHNSSHFSTGELTGGLDLSIKIPPQIHRYHADASCIAGSVALPWDTSPHTKIPQSGWLTNENWTQTQWP